MSDTAVGDGRMLPEHSRAPALHAGFWLRFVAYLIDGFITGAVATVIYIVLFLGFVLPHMAGGGHGEVGAMAVLFAVFEVVVLVGVWLYFALCESSHLQATPGKLALGLHVTDLYGRRIGFGRATGRFFGKILSGLIFDIGFMLAGWTPRKQALHDLLAGCCVVRRDGLAAFEQDGFAPGVPAVARGGMPGWAIAVAVIGIFVFVVSPVAILAAIAVPAYQNYLVRTQVAEGQALADGAKVAVDAYIAKHGTVPVDNAAAGLAAPASMTGRYVSDVTLARGRIIVTYGGAADAAIAGDHLALEPYGSRNAVQWRCSSPDIDAKYLPMTCR